ncbi:MAG: hypothetical protein PHV60_01100 [bacterium]|nr:hypothetical protein [bacterium]
MKKMLFLWCFVFIPLYLFAADKPLPDNLVAKITIPYKYALVRGDVPIYGMACGQDFQSYKLEYGPGEDPTQWVFISSSTKEAKEGFGFFKIDFSLDKTIPGNLGMWDTGLSEYQYGNHKVDLPVGIYTLKLTVVDKKGRRVEDKIMVEVGRVILNSIDSQVGSPDGQALFIVPEHSLYRAVEVMSLLPLPVQNLPLPRKTRLASKIYELNPPGTKFIRPAKLQINYSLSPDMDKHNLQIYYYDPGRKKWQPLKTYLSNSADSVWAALDTIPDKFALYAVLENKRIVNEAEINEQAAPRDENTAILIENTFEQNLGEWHSDYLKTGAILNRNRKQYHDRSRCLKLTNRGDQGNFACSMISKPYYANQYNILEFDYKIPPGVKINILAKVNNKWYDIVLTDDEKIYWDINMEKIGAVRDILADDQWHHAKIDLGEMLKGRTNDFIVQDLELANWDCTGFMKLERGKNPPRAFFYIDNFVIRKQE